MERKKGDKSTKIRQMVNYPRFDTLEEQKAFQLGLACAFNANAECSIATARAVITKGEEILKSMGWNGIMFDEVKNDDK